MKLLIPPQIAHGRNIQIFRMTYLPLFLLFSLLNTGGAAKADSLHPGQTQAPAFAVSIAVPEESGQHIIRLSTADPHFDVVIRNISHQPQDLYAEDCSEGYDTLRLELIGIDDKPLPEPIIVKRSVSVWYSNAIRTVTLEPGAVLVRELHFTKDESCLGHVYHNFPPMGAGDVHRIRMRAILEYEPGGGFTQHFHRRQTAAVSSVVTPSKAMSLSNEKTSPNPWAGRVVSATNDYLVQQYYP